VVMVETTIDDLDPRVYPDVLVAVKAAGALEAWLTPVIMKQGRPGVILSAVAPHSAATSVSDAIFRHTTTLGVRQTPVHREVLDRDHIEVHVDGQPVSIKRGLRGGQVVNVQPELRDAQAAAKTLDRPLHRVLDAARATAQRETHPPA
jgi:pyridinium-3,5-bisthiocarboxylic acid mononucleotide nickel chelatase